MKLISYCNRIIEYSFYALFLLVPLLFSGDTSELFEFNKMWFTFGITTLIGTAWITKMIVERRIFVLRTPLDIPIMLFLLSQIISTLFSLDQHVSWWGYYSRFNGGLLSTISYVFLYYAFVTNLQTKHVLRSLGVSLVAGVITVVWGFPAHFGYDPTCLIFRGQFDVSCWTKDFQPTVRTFSTLGQPAWFAAYIVLFLPLLMSYALISNKIKFWLAYALSIFFYISLIFTDTRAGFIAFWVVWIAHFLFWGIVLLQKKVSPWKKLHRTFTIFTVSFAICSFLFGIPVGQLNKYTLPQLTNPQQTAPKPQESLSGATQPPVTSGITDSGDIRLLVWQGAVDAWRSNPIFGTGVETFAFAYYKSKPAAHNLTSEWDFLYNKAHNEYLNYLATTGLFGLGTYLAFLLLFLFITSKWLITVKHTKETTHRSGELPIRTKYLLIVGLVTSWLSILITNFFGFSVVIMNLYLFLIPAFVLIIAEMLNHERVLAFPTDATHHTKVGPFQWTFITIVVLISLWMHYGLMMYRQADIAYALGTNLDRTGNFQDANPKLVEAFKMEPNEPVYKDELSINLGALASMLYSQKDSTQAAQLAQNAIALSNDVVNSHPNNVVYWKNRVRVLYTLSTTDPEHGQAYLGQALQAINTAKKLAPNDARVAYSQGILYGQTGQLDKALELLTETVKLKPNYLDAYVALGLFYHQQAVDKNQKVIHSDKQQKAIETYQYILKNISPDNKEVKDALKTWQNE